MCGKLFYLKEFFSEEITLKRQTSSQPFQNIISHENDSKTQKKASLIFKKRRKQNSPFKNINVV